MPLRHSRRRSKWIRRGPARIWRWGQLVLGTPLRRSHQPTQVRVHARCDILRTARGARGRVRSQRVDGGGHRERQAALRLVGDNAGANALGRDFANSGYQAATRALYDQQLKQVSARRVADAYVSPVVFALLYIKLGKADEAFK